MKKKKEKKSIINNSELISMEYLDYLFYRGNWEINDYVNKNLYGKYLHIYNILEDDIFKIIPGVNNLFHGTKPSVLLQKKNNEFELKEEEINNIYVPKSNVKNSLFGEMILLNYDNLSNVTINNIIRNSLKTTNNEIKINVNDYVDENKLEMSEQNNNKINSKETPHNNNNIYAYSYIPVKICLIGHSFSGRKTQAKL